MKVGFIRVSTEDQNTIRQEILMKQLGVERVYIEIASGKSRTGRPQLEAMMDFVREGDVVIVESISRFARSTRDLLTLVEQLTEKGVGFVSQKESIDTNTPQGKFSCSRCLVQWQSWNGSRPYSGREKELRLQKRLESTRDASR